MARHRGALVLGLCAVAAGCGSGDDEGLPSACPTEAGQVLAALRTAPRPVRLRGVPLSECLTKRASSGELQQVGATYVSAASALSARARRNPRGPDTVRLGYLVGAVRRGARATGGLHAELERRLEQELATLGRLPPGARRGERAGRASG
jgi:hypothetical protein